ncbi:family 4 glycosyl hydrolase [Acidipropionibacterium jensenii]|uniref:family 4 glycosyl hydrolase n=1 Tax=Acidipropionibacterium jensenii TaxID=1749 RepID=UPI00214CCB58|nr:6-phospho-beta-glucosidase [Acidipropionibacterium jensenii]
MKLALLGGGGFRVPLVFNALLSQHGDLIDDLWLYDTEADRLQVIRNVLTQAHGDRPGPTLHITTDLAEAVRGADFVFSAIRVGGLAGRVHDERAALDLGVLGQETTGAAGIAFALRTGPVALEIARTVAAEAPRAFVINFTNPAGIMTELMQTVLGDRVIGICDTPSGLGKRVGALYGAREFELSLDYVGLNHLGWLRHAWYHGRDLVAEVLSEPDKLARLEEADVFSVEWMQRLGALPNEYLYYWYSTREAIASILSADATRGEFLQAQQSRFYQQATAHPERALQLWTATHDEREATYMAEARDEGEERPDLTGGGYERVALALMRAIALGERAEMIVNVRNGHTLAALPPDAVIEVPCLVDAAGAHPLSTEPPGGAELGLMMQMKAVEQLAIRAVLEQDRGLAFEALAKHPLVGSVEIAEKLTEAFWPQQ